MRANARYIYRTPNALSRNPNRITFAQRREEGQGGEMINFVALIGYGLILIGVGIVAHFILELLTRKHGALHKPHTEAK